MKQLRLIPVLILLALIALLFAGADFSGTWRLNAESSDFGMFPAPDKMIYRISKEDSQMVIDWEFSGSRGTMNGTATYRTDGGEMTNTFGKLSLTSKAHWEDSVLRVKSWGDMGGNLLEFKDSFSLESPTRLKVERVVDGPGGTMNQLMVFDKVSE